MPAKHAKEEKACSVLPRRSVIQRNITKLASIATRSTAAQRVNPVSDGSCLLHWLMSAAIKIHSHPDVGSCGGRALATAVALQTREILAGAPKGAAQYSADP